MSVRENFADIYLRGMRYRSMRGGIDLAREIQLTAGNLSNRSAGVLIPRDICNRFGRYLYSTKCSHLDNKLEYFFIDLKACYFIAELPHRGRAHRYECTYRPVWREAL